MNVCKKEKEKKVKLLSHVQLFATPWTVCSLPGSCSMGFSRQEYWIGLPFPSPGDIPNQGLNLGLLNCRQMLYPLSHQGSLFRNSQKGSLGPQDTIQSASLSHRHPKTPQVYCL